ncbi:MAG: large conductance mechanosensitive channel protein MscL [Clostridia bacterium]|nr:large conductance mechanosensitive channel protein MscL [Clostridia bacterium]
MAKEKKKGFFGEFKEFIMRGNVLDMAVGVIIATAFGAITSTLINKVLMPLIGYLFGGVDLAKLNITLKDAVIEDGEVTSEAVVIAIGEFIAAIINFVIVALIVFCIVKAFNRVRNLKKKEEEEAPAEEPAPAEPTVEEKTLETLNQIKELLENK